MLGDHLGSTTLTANADGTLASGQTYTAWGETRSGSVSTDRQYTGQISEPQLGIYFYNARYYDPYLAQFTQPDSIVPDPRNPLDWNRYTYARYNPVKYTDPTGHLPCLSCEIALFIESFINDEVDQIMRDRTGGALVTKLTEDIARESSARGVNPTLVSAVIRHESGARERRIFGPAANLAERAEAKVREETGLASIGIGQMQVRRARELEQLGYVSVQPDYWSTVNALLDPKQATAYVAGMMQYLNDQLTSTYGDLFTNLSPDDQERLLLIGYNQGWDGDDVLRAIIDNSNFRNVIDQYTYDNQTLDNYEKWRSQMK